MPLASCVPKLAHGGTGPAGREGCNECAAKFAFRSSRRAHCSPWSCAVLWDRGGGTAVMAHDLTTSPATPFNSLVLPGGVPELENGDRLTRAEIERRYAAMPAVKQAELSEGVVHVPSAVRVRRHGRPHAHLIHWMTSYSAETPGVEVADNSSNRLDLDNEVQPHGMLFILPECGGQVRISEDDYVEGAAELIG